MHGTPAYGPAGKPRAVLFDLDGTLVDTAPDLGRALERALLEVGLPADGGAEQARAWVGGGAAALVRRGLCHALGREPDEELEQRVLESFLAAYEHDICRAGGCYPGARESLDALARAGLRLACVTNKRARFTVKLLRELELLERFDSVVSGDTSTAPKPDPAPLLQAARELGLAPGQCLMVGDSDNDVHAARAAGMKVLWCSHGYHRGKAPQVPEIDGVLPALGSLPALLGIDR